MRKWMTFLMALMVGANSYANAFGTIGVEAGYRQDTVSLKSGLTQNVEVRHKFSDLDIFQVGVKGQGTFGSNFYARGEATWGWILDGKYVEKFSVVTEGVGQITKFKDVADDRYVFGANVAIGYPFFFSDCTMSLAPTVGYAFDEQNLRLNRGNITFKPESNTPLEGTQSYEQRFISRWFGPSLGVDFQYVPVNESWNVFAQFGYHWAQFKTRTHTKFENIPDYLASHAKRGHGIVFNVGVQYDFCDCWTAGFAVKVSDFHAHKKHHVKKSDLAVKDAAQEVSHGRDHFAWKSLAVNLLVGRAF